MWFGLRVGGRLALLYIHQMNRVELSQWPGHDDSTINIVVVIIIIIIIIIIKVLQFGKLDSSRVKLFARVLVAQLDAERVQLVGFLLVAPVQLQFRLPVTILPAPDNRRRHCKIAVYQYTLAVTVTVLNLLC